MHVRISGFKGVSPRAAAVAALAALVAAAAPGCTPIPPERDPYSTRARGEPGLPIMSLQWKHAVSDRMRESKPQEFASPALYGEQLFVGSDGGVFYALSARDGAVLWEKEIGAVSSQPAVDVLRGRVYVGTDDGVMLSLRATDGSELWRYATRGPILQPPVLVDGLLIFSNEADHVYALDSDTGAFRWQYKGEPPDEYTLRGHAGVTVSDGMVFTGLANGTLVALRQASGSVAWLTSIAGDGERFVDADGTPVVRGDTVYATSSTGGLVAVDRTTGLLRWRLAIEGAGPLTAEDGRIYVAAADQGIYAVAPSGQVIWRQGTRGGGEPARPVVSGSYLIYALSEDGLFIADKRTGRLYQFFDPGDGVSATPTLDAADDQLYALSNRGLLYALSLQRF